MIITPKRRAKLFKFCRITKLPYLPFILGIETGNICNLKCPLCPTGSNNPAMKKGFMSLALFKSIINQLKNSISSINLYSWGEPLLNTDLIPMVEYVKSRHRNIKVVTSTNLNIQNERLLSDLLISGIDKIIVSCDGVSQDTYTEYRSGGDYNLVMCNLKYLISTSKNLCHKPEIIWNFLVFRHNENEVPTAQKIANALGINITIGKIRTSMGEEILKPHTESIQKDKDWIPNNPEYSAYDKTNLTTVRTIKTCRKPWQEISINWDGAVFPCCAIYGDEYNFGNINNNSIKEIWNNRLYATARKEILSNKGKANIICGICRNNGFLHM